MKRIGLISALLFALSGCGESRSGSGIEILNIEFLGDGKPQIKLVDPKEGVRVVHIGDKVDGMQVIGADEKGVTLLGAGGEKIRVENK